MTVDARTLRHTAGHFVTGVTVILVEVEGEVRAMTANSFTSLSLDPPLVLFCVRCDSRMSEAIYDGAAFSVNILAEDQQDLSSYFAGTFKGSPEPAYTLLEWANARLLEGCVAAISCVVDRRYEGGDHWIVVGRVLALHNPDLTKRPLLFARGRYSRLDPAS
mgnify:CR=1 FL=1